MASQLLPVGFDTIVIDGGWAGDTVDAHGRPTPDVGMWPSAAGGKGFKPLADWTHSLGLKFGVWTLRGVLPAAVEAKLPVLGADPPATLDQVALVCTSPHDRWCNCTWDKQGAGLNPSHPAAQSFYHSQVDLYAGWGVDLIKWDCMYEGPQPKFGLPGAYAGEAVLALNAVEAHDRPITLSWSPGGGMSLDSAAWMTDSAGPQHGPPNTTSPSGVRGSLFRATGDFHSVPVSWVDGLGEHLFVLGNLSTRNLLGVDGAFADSDILDLGHDSAFFGTPAAQLHASMWMMAKSPLMYGGQLPITDATTLDLVTNKLALLVNSHSSSDMQVDYKGDCSCRPKSGFACHPHNTPGAAPCVATWWSSLGKCKAVAVLNVGAVAAPSVSVGFAQIGLPASSKSTVTDVYKQKSWVTVTVAVAGFRVSVPGMGGTLLIVAPAGTDPAACVSA